MIPVCEPLLGEKEINYVLDCLRTNWISSQGKYISQFEEGFARYCGSRFGVCTTNGTTALHLAMASLGLGSGDEVILPTFTMVASAFAIVYTGARPVLVDAERDTWNMDVAQIEDKITPRTKAIMPVHIYGHACDMDPILNIARARGLFIIEDAAEAHGAEYKGRKAGSMSHIGCFSFYANKIITTGEGGMVVTDDEGIARKARRLKDLAHSEEQRFSHPEVGFNYRMTNIQAALGLAQLERIEELVERRRRNARLYNNRLKDIDGLGLPPEKEWARNVYWMYGITVRGDGKVNRDKLMAGLAKAGIETRAFFIPMHQQPVFRSMRLFEGESYPVADELSREGIYLPSSSGLREGQIDFICDAVRSIMATA